MKTRSRQKTAWIWALLGLALHACALATPRATGPAPPRLAENAFETIGSTGPELVARLAEVDTRSPRSRQSLAAARQLFEFLRRADIESEIISRDGGRASVYARLPASNARDPRPLVLLSHFDTHPADPRAWKTDRGPTSGAIVDGAVWGRGVLHGKGAAALFALTLTVLAGAYRTLPHDIILIVTPDALFGDGLSLTAVIDRYPEIATAGLALSNGGASRFDMFDRGRLNHAVITSERGFARLKVVAAARSDEVGTLAKDVVVDRLQRALHALDAAAHDPRITPPTALTLDYVSVGLWFPRTWAYRSSALAHVFLLPGLAARETTRTLVTDSIRVTELYGGSGNTLASADRAQAFLLSALLPDSTPARIRTRLVRAIDDGDVHVTIKSAVPWSGTDPSEEVLARIARHAHRKDVDRDQIVVPIMGPETTDARILRNRGVPVYGFVPLLLDEAQARSIRGRNEHLRLADLSNAVVRLSGLVMDLVSFPGDASEACGALMVPRLYSIRKSWASLSTSRRSDR